MISIVLAPIESSIASRIIADTVEGGLTKAVDAETKAKKFMTYLHIDRAQY